MYLLTSEIKTTNVVFTAFQETGIELKLEFALPEFNADKSTVCGTVLNELFRWVELQRAVRAKGMKLSLPIMLRFQVGGICFDTSMIKRKELLQTLKLQNNPKGRKRYAVSFWKVFSYATSKVEAKNMTELLAGLEKQLAVLKVA